MENTEDIEEFENDKVGYQGIKMVAASLFIIGLIFLAIIYSDFIHRDDPKLAFFFDIKDGLPDLADSLLGTTGLCWSLAGTLLFFYTILQTRQEMNLQIKEMKQTNNTLISQKYETTFFNLLENQKSILNNVVYKEHLKGKTLVGSTALGYIVGKINKYLEIYNQSLANEYFNSLDETKFNQIYLFQRFEVLSSISNSLIHIIEYIIEKLDNSEFHHKTLYYNLTNDEKFIIGLVLHNKVRFIRNLQFDYTQYYLANSNYPFLDNNIPVCNITDLLHHKVKKLVFTEFSEFEKLIRKASKFTFIANEDIKPIRITSTINIDILTENVFNYPTPIVTNSINHHKIETMEFDLYHFFKDYLLDFLNTNKDAKSYSISVKKLGFVFSFNNSVYEVLIGDVEMNLNMINNELEIKFFESKYIDSEDLNIYTQII